MNSSTKFKVLHFAINALFLISLIASGYTFVNYSVTRDMLNTTEVLRPIYESTLETVESNLPQGGNTTDILSMLKAEQELAVIKYKIWLNYVQSQQIAVRNQLIMCLSLLGLSLIALFAINWKQNAP
jgi:hypothetical protein